VKNFDDKFSRFDTMPDRKRWTGTLRVATAYRG